MHSTPGIDMTSGSLGNGIAIGAGMALAAKAQGKDYYTYVICGGANYRKVSAGKESIQHQEENWII